VTYREAFAAAVARLAHAPHPTETPELDARVLLGHAAGLSHAALLARWNDVFDADGPLEAALLRRLAGEPVAWITGTKEFLGLEFETPPGLLVPRPDTETLVEAALGLLPPLRGTSEPPLRVVDICTGTGCVAVGLVALSEVPIEAWAGDVSPLAVATARWNAGRLIGGRLTVVESDLLEALPGPWDLIVSNPPYLTSAETHERVVDGGWREPALALDGGPDGLQLPRRLIRQAHERLTPGGWFLMEAAGPQMTALASYLEDAGFSGIRTWKDLAGIDRVVGGRS
jgi:release factor glutamine methyltransferase